MADFLLELLSEEIPARMQPAAAAQLAAKLGSLLVSAGLPAQRIEAHATPRRIAAIAWGLPPASTAQREERRGPRFDAPDAAVAGFLKSTGLQREQLETRDDPKGRFLYAVIERPGVSAADALAALLPAMIESFDWPKSMRWGAASVSTAAQRWVRPLRKIVALLDTEIVPFTALGVAAGRETQGHRFMGGPVTVETPATYAAQLRASHVILSAAERAGIIRNRAAVLAAEAGLAVVPDADLEAENAGLTEWPVPLLGRFNPAFLTVPPEVIQLTMRANQKYFALRHSTMPPPSPDAREQSRHNGDEGGSDSLAPAFICVANIEGDPTRIVAGNERVLSARLSDARFFWDRDRGVPLESLAPRLGDIVFHAMLGTVADRVERIARLARWIVENGAAGGAEADRGRLADRAERAARLAKCDLVTGTVGEFPEVQGIAGGHLARVQGEDGAVADAVRDHYRPVGHGDAVPSSPVTVAVALADKLDSLGRFFAINEVPTGSKDPFALRRAALGVLRILLENRIRFDLKQLIQACCYDELRELADNAASDGWKPVVALESFFVDRFTQLLRDRKARHDLVAAVIPGGGAGFDVVQAYALCDALAGLLATDDGANLLAGYRRAANILRKEGWTDGIGTGASTDALEPAEQALAEALGTATPALEAAMAREDFPAAAAALAALRAPIDAFFTEVTVNAPDLSVRARRLAMLAQVRDAMHRLADFSKIEG